MCRNLNKHDDSGWSHIWFNKTNTQLISCYSDGCWATFVAVTTTWNTNNKVLYVFYHIIDKNLAGLVIKKMLTVGGVSILATVVVGQWLGK